MMGDPHSCYNVFLLDYLEGWPLRPNSTFFVISVMVTHPVSSVMVTQPVSYYWNQENEGSIPLLR